mmetsp:Transcript_2786/g.3271  ORF Transcript_2786/g.3271 Transcript_2786/m.3271 type:complete len:486 (-) Transcript_2786:1193-2650(-)|eukprot:CAMPEP_0184010736 /NCGR_PEP_ID=MMETSP0954-20121128/3399_1 /TAXON_ID=627963 /ORGANISM="Aplanochytrium sp, Strain PBS07" /LENGTH=485 /DNA_ID=CAMNT_0026290399 /DNA_START=47 /DNA_END=1504 /DNA_ORIENTATION=+
MASFPKEELNKFVSKKWNGECIPELEKYIKIPNLSPYFDPEVLTNGHQDKAMDLILDWVKLQEVKGAEIDLVREEGRTPLLFVEIQASESVNVEEVGTVLLYGHMDKQPPFEGWMEGLGPYTPVIKDGKLYGRGGADDGYACFAAITAIKGMQEAGIPHGRYVLIIEASEESGSPDLPFYIQSLKQRIGRPNLIVCLDSGCANYDQLWVTTSLRGALTGRLKVEVLSEGVHSGSSSGIVPDTFRIARQIVSRLENEMTGEVVPEWLYVDIPEKVKENISKAADLLGKEGLVDCFPFLDGVKPVEADSLAELALNMLWRPQLAVTGASGLPDAAAAGNVLRPSTTLALSLRLPPTLPSEAAKDKLKALLEDNPPYGAKITFDCGKSGTGWSAPPTAPWLEQAAELASQRFYGKSAMYLGEGGTIPFMAMLGDMFPEAQFLITGVLGPKSNAHGPNEFLHIDYSEKLTCCLISVLSSHCETKVELKK